MAYPLESDDTNNLSIFEARAKVGTRTVLHILILVSFSPFLFHLRKRPAYLRPKAEGEVAIFGRLVLLLALVARVGADQGLREDDARSPAALARDILDPNLSRPRLGLTETNHGRGGRLRRRWAASVRGRGKSTMAAKPRS